MMGSGAALAAVPQRGGKPAHGQQDAALNEFVVVARSVPPQQLDLEVVQRLQIWEPVENRAGQSRVVGEQVVMSGDQPVYPDGAFVFGGDHVEYPSTQRLVVDQLCVPRGQTHVRLGK